MAKPKPELTPEQAIADAEAAYNTSLSDESKEQLTEVVTFLNSDAATEIAEQVAALHTTSAKEIQDAYAARLAELTAEVAALDAQDPIVYRYIGSAVEGERLVHVPLSDIRQSLWAELPPWVQRSVKASKLYTKVDEVN